MSILERRVGERFAEARRAAGLTQEEVAERVGCATESVGRLERGALMPSVARLTAAAKVVGVDLADLLRDEPRTRRDVAIGRIVALLRERPADDAALVAELLERVFRR